MIKESKTGQWIKDSELDMASRIAVLRQEAACAGDAAQVRLCDRALSRGEDSTEWRECERVIREAAGHELD